MWSVILLHRYISVLGLASHFSPFRLLNVAMETFTLINPTGEEGTTDGKKPSRTVAGRAEQSEGSRRGAGRRKHTGGSRVGCDRGLLRGLRA